MKSPIQWKVKGQNKAHHHCVYKQKKKNPRFLDKKNSSDYLNEYSGVLPSKEHALLYGQNQGSFETQKERNHIQNMTAV